jgi:GrpB-like predicted nucleotidyltransferase (UPF0157 family)
MIVIADYNPEWPALYEEERGRILHAIGNHVAGIEHVGSTSVPGLAAKPIVDILVGLHSESLLDSVVQPMQALGHTYVPEYEDEMPYRRLFYKKPPTYPQAYNVHVVSLGHEFWVRHLLFRDYVRAHPEVARRYEELKRQLAPQFIAVNDYATAKTDFIRSVEAQAIRELELASG